MNVPPKRNTPRLKVEVKSASSTMATVMGSQYARCQMKCPSQSVADRYTRREPYGMSKYSGAYVQVCAQGRERAG